jgi:hypothetical protein
MDDERIKELKAYRQRFTDPPRSPLAEGDIVYWKKGLKNRRFPKEDDPAIVIELVEDDDVRNPQEDSGSPYFREPLDIILGFIDPDGDFVMYHFDSRRFERRENV